MTAENAAGQDGTVDAAGTASAPPDDPQELREEIERTREQLGETVQVLAAKADVKARAQDKAGQVTERLKDKAGQARQQVAATAGQISAVTPEPVQRAAATAASTARQRRVPVAVAIGAVAVAWLLIARWRRR
jgi:CHASE3 domain sensor protein